MALILEVGSEIEFTYEDLYFKSVLEEDFWYFPNGMQSILTIKEIPYVEIDYDFPPDIFPPEP